MAAPRPGSLFFPDWLLQHWRRPSRPWCPWWPPRTCGKSTRRVEKLVEQLGVASLSRSQVSEMATAQVVAFRNWPLDSVWGAISASRL